MEKHLPILAADRIEVDLKNDSYRDDFNRKIPVYTADISFLVGEDDPTVVATVRLSGKAVQDFISSVEDLQHQITNSR